MILSIVLFVLGLAAVLFVINELANFSVYGAFIKKQELRAFLARHLSEYRLNTYDSDLLSACDTKTGEEVPYLAMKGRFSLGKWYVKDYGQVWRWSYESKLIDARQKALLSSLPKDKRLSDI